MGTKPVQASPPQCGDLRTGQQTGAHRLGTGTTSASSLYGATPGGLKSYLLLKTGEASAKQLVGYEASLILARIMLPRVNHRIGRTNDEGVDFTQVLPAMLFTIEQGTARLPVRRNHLNQDGVWHKP